MSASTQAIADLITANLPRDLILGVEEALTAGASRGFEIARLMHEGHRATAVGQMRHLNMNETFHEALLAAGARPSNLKGNGLVIGRAGIFTLGRFNLSAGLWNNSRRSSTRRQMALANRAIETLVQPQLFEKVEPVSEGVIFFVSLFSGSLRERPEAPLSIELAIPDRTMKHWLFRESLPLVLKRYEKAAVRQPDGAFPTLKVEVAKGGGGV